MPRRTSAHLRFARGARLPFPWSALSTASCAAARIRCAFSTSLRSVFRAALISGLAARAAAASPAA
eukprot:2418210-Lingulodinium_polyedra.AAC.1